MATVRATAAAKVLGIGLSKRPRRPSRSLWRCRRWCRESPGQSRSGSCRPWRGGRTTCPMAHRTSHDMTFLGRAVTDEGESAGAQTSDENPLALAGGVGEAMRMKIQGVRVTLACCVRTRSRPRAPPQRVSQEPLSQHALSSVSAVLAGDGPPPGENQRAATRRTASAASKTSRRKSRTRTASDPVQPSRHISPVELDQAAARPQIHPARDCRQSGSVRGRRIWVAITSDPQFSHSAIRRARKRRSAALRASPSAMAKCARATSRLPQRSSSSPSDAA